MDEGMACPMPRAAGDDEAGAMSRMLAAKRIAVVGLSDDPAKPSNYVSAYLRLADWYEEAGRVEESARYRNHAIQVVNFYKDKRTTDPFDDLLLGRPPSPTHP